MDFSSISSDDLIAKCISERSTAAWEEFVLRFNPLIAKVVLRIARRWGECSGPILDDLVQETYLKLCADNYRVLRNFKPHQPDAAYGFLKVITANVVHDHFKSSHALRRGSGNSPESIELAETYGESARNQSSLTTLPVERTILLHEIDQHLARSLPPAELPRSRLVFWLYYRSGLTASAIASLPAIGLSTKGVESMLFRLTGLVKMALSQPIGERKENKQDTSQDQEGFRQAESF